MAARGWELYYIIFQLSSKHDSFYFDYSVANCITLLFHCQEYFHLHLTAIKELIEEALHLVTGRNASCLFCQRCGYTYWLEEIAAEEDHEPVVIDLAPGYDCSSDNDTASMAEGI